MGTDDTVREEAPDIQMRPRGYRVLNAKEFRFYSVGISFSSRKPGRPSVAHSSGLYLFKPGLMVLHIPDKLFLNIVC